MKQLIQPKSWVIILFVIGGLFGIFAWYEFQSSKQDVYSLMQQEGFVLLDAMLASSERSMLANEALEEALEKRLASNALLLNQIDALMPLSQNRLDTLITHLDLYRIHVINRQGRCILSNSVTHAERSSVHQYSWVLDSLQTSGSDVYVIGYRTGGVGLAQFAVAVRRDRGGAIIVAVDAERRLVLSKQVGTGRLIQEIGRRPGVVYAAIQDTAGIWMASKGVQTLSALPKDDPLFQAYTSRTRVSRIMPYQEQPVFEISGPFILEGSVLGMMRIGLALSHYTQINQRAQYRLLLTVFILAVVGMAGVTLVLITQRHRLLSDSYARVQTHTGEILQQMEDAVVAVDENGRISIFNNMAEVLFGLSRNQMIGKPLENLPPVFDDLKTALKNGNSLKREEIGFEINGRDLMVSRTVSVLKNEDGGVDGVIFVATDMTQTRQLKIQLERQERLKSMGAMASGVAHEVRNPVNAIGMIAQRLKKEFQVKSDSEEYGSLVKTMISEVRRINDIIRQFLEFARPPKLNLVTIQSDHLLHAVSDVFRSSAQTADIQFLLQMDGTAPLFVDADQMKQALLNLLKNALEACESGQTIILKGEKTAGQYQIAVIDEGAGMTREVTNRIFDLYYTTKAEGTGMGLPLVQQIVQVHGGRLEVESVPGEGSCFRVYVPAADMVRKD